MHVQRNRRAFLHVRNFKNFVDELYLVRMYEDQTQYLTQFTQTKKLKCLSKFHEMHAVLQNATRILNNQC